MISGLLIRCDFTTGYSRKCSVNVHVQRRRDGIYGTIRFYKLNESGMHGSECSFARIRVSLRGTFDVVRDQRPRFGCRAGQCKRSIREGPKSRSPRLRFRSVLSDHQRVTSAIGNCAKGFSIVLIRLTIHSSCPVKYSLQTRQCSCVEYIRRVPLPSVDVLSC